MNRRRFLKALLGVTTGLATWAYWPEPARTIAPRQSCWPTDNYIRLMATGDIMMHQGVINGGLQEDGSYDYSPYFEFLTPLFRNADVVIGNLETPLAGQENRGYTGYPSFNAPEALAGNLKKVGFTHLNLANNHALDRGWPGLARTIEEVEKAGLVRMGAYVSAEDRARLRIVELGGVKAGFFGYTYGINGPLKYPNGETWRLDVIEETLLLNDLAFLRAAGTDFAVFNLHFGDEYQLRPNISQGQLVSTLIQAGVDLIIGHHPHVIQPGRVWPQPAGGQAAVYSLGNLLSNQDRSHTNQGLILETTLGFDLSGQKLMGPIILRPTRCHQFLLNGRNSYRVIPVANPLSDHPAAYGLTSEEAQTYLTDSDETAWRLVNCPETRLPSAT